MSPSNKAAAMPDDATANAMPLFDRISARISEMRIVLPVLPGASKKKNPLCPAENAGIMKS